MQTVGGEAELHPSAPVRPCCACPVALPPVLFPAEVSLYSTLPKAAYLACPRHRGGEPCGACTRHYSFRQATD